MPAATVTVDKSGERVKRMFASIAPRYDLMNHLLSLGIDRRWRKKTVRLLPPIGDDPILDVCTGTGDLALAYHRRTGGKVPIVGTDFCPEMLAIARSKAESDSNVTWLEADTQALPFNDNHFQLVVVAFGIRNVADTMAGLKEMVRVCRPGGRVGVLEFSKPDVQPFKTLYRWYFTKLLPIVGQRLARNDHQAYEYLPNSVSEFATGEEFARQLRAAGLAQVRYHPFTLGIATLYIGEKTSF
jgi:demethylmenaquinone methyltransferase/2-methoxy-6-polyprenyl-1,4-benzoquinol methylase